jgi:hypothetical protein
MLKPSGLAAVMALAVVAALPGAASARPARAAPAAVAPAEVSIPNTRRVAFVSKVNGHSYSISVALPSDPAPAKGYGVLYVLDGDAYFASAVEAARANGNTSGVVVVGVGYPDTPRFASEVLARHAPVAAAIKAAPPFVAAVTLERMYDMALPASDEALAGQSIAGVMAPKSRDVGGMDDFLRMIETDIKPRVAALAKVDPANQALFGHSLGGLAVVRALFTEPTAFRTFIAASPSIWWNSSAVLAGEAGFDAEVTSGAAHPRVLITVGAKEEEVPTLPPEMEAVRPQVEALVRKSRMVGNACDLAARLKALKGAAPYEVEDCAVFAGQDHGISPWPALGRAIAFAF